MTYFNKILLRLERKIVCSKIGKNKKTHCIDVTYDAGILLINHYYITK